MSALLLLNNSEFVEMCRKKAESTCDFRGVGRRKGKQNDVTTRSYLKERTLMVWGYRGLDGVEMHPIGRFVKTEQPCPPVLMSVFVRK